MPQAIAKLNDVPRRPQEITFRQIDEPNGSLIALTGSVEIPFPIKRVFFLFDVPKGEVRGEHAHRECHQVLFALRGNIEVAVHDGFSEQPYQLSASNKGLWIPPLFWARQRYIEAGSILAVLTDQPYQEADYIRDFKEFMKVAGPRRTG